MAESLGVSCDKCPQIMENDTREKSITNPDSCAPIQKNWNVDTDIDLFLLGTTGNGKSATGNSILHYKAFESSADTYSVTNKVDFDYTEFNGRVIKVVDVRGIEDTRMPTAQSRALFISEMEYAMLANPKGYHAFLIVLKYGNRFTQQQMDTIKFLKALFGKTFVKDHCIIIMTCGDIFYEDHMGELSFKTWCEQETSTTCKDSKPFRELLQECCNRIVLFNNISEAEAEKKKQVTELQNLVDQLNGIRYTNDNFKQAELAQIKLESKIQSNDNFKQEELAQNKLEYSRYTNDIFKQAELAQNKLESIRYTNDIFKQAELAQNKLESIRYTNDIFKQAELAQYKLESEVAYIRQYAIKEERLIFQKLKSCQDSLFDELVVLENLLVRTEAFMENLKGFDKESKVFQDFIDYAAAIKDNISLEIKVHVDIKQWRKSFKETQKNMKLKVDSEKEKLTNQYLKSIANSSDDIKKRLKKELDEKIKKAETILEQEKQVMEGEFFREINKRREKIKLERFEQEIKYREMKSNYIEQFVSSLKHNFRDGLILNEDIFKT